MNKIILILSIYLFSAFFSIAQEKKIHKNELSTTISYGKLFSTFERPPFEYTPVVLSSTFKHYLTEKFSLNFQLNFENYLNFKSYIDCFYMSGNIFLTYDILNFSRIKLSAGIGPSSAFYWLTFSAYKNLQESEQGFLVFGIVSNLNIYYCLKNNSFFKLVTDYEYNIPYKKNLNNLRIGIAYGVKF